METVNLVRKIDEIVQINVLVLVSLLIINVIKILNFEFHNEISTIPYPKSVTID